MNPIPVVVLSEVHKFSLKVLGVSKKQVVKVFTTNRPDQSLNKGMGIGRQLPCAWRIDTQAAAGS
ncbi:MAG: hypothetical protein WBN43_05965 [Thiogranum sp.]